VPDFFAFLEEPRLPFLTVVVLSVRCFVLLCHHGKEG